MDRRTFAKQLALGVGSVYGQPLEALGVTSGARERPNLVYLCSDQHSGKLMMGGKGLENPVQTPNLERLAARGVSFRNVYCGSPLCAPGRASMISGMYASDVNSFGNATVFQGDTPTWGTHLQKAGYRCWATGKMDLTSQRDIGFEQVEVSHEHDKSPDVSEFFRRPMCFRADERGLVNGLSKDRAGADRTRLERGQQFVAKRLAAPGQPWAAYIGLSSPHPPFEAPERYLDLYPETEIELPRIDPAEFDREATYFSALRNFSMISAPISDKRQRSARRAYYAMITELDDLLGPLLTFVEQERALDNTVVLYTSDHGEMYGNHALWLKRSLYEEAARVPLIMAGAGLPRGLVIDTPVSDVDVTATILDLAGVEKPAHLRGRSLLPLIRGDTAAAPLFVYSEAHMEGACTGAFMLRKGDWKYLHFSFYDDHQLFNLSSDPGEHTNLYGRPDFADVQKDLVATLYSVVDPEEVTLRAFARQESMLRDILGKHTQEEFTSMLERRLGKGQAELLARKEYARST